MTVKLKPISCRSISRRAHAVESFSTAAECIGRIEKGISIFAITRGQFSMLDAVSVAIKQLSDQAGPVTFPSGPGPSPTTRSNA